MHGYVSCGGCYGVNDRRAALKGAVGKRDVSLDRVIAVDRAGACLPLHVHVAKREGVSAGGSTVLGTEEKCIVVAGRLRSVDHKVVQGKGRFGTQQLECIRSAGHQGEGVLFTADNRECLVGDGRGGNRRVGQYVNGITALCSRNGVCKVGVVTGLIILVRTLAAYLIIIETGNDIGLAVAQFKRSAVALQSNVLEHGC